MHNNTVFSPHIFIYKPQVNSVFSLFLRFILIILFLDFFIYSLNFLNSNFLSALIFNTFVDFILLTEVVLSFYIISILGEEFIDYDSMNLNYWDIDLVTFFRFFLSFFVILVIILFVYLVLQFIFGTSLVIC